MTTQQPTVTVTSLPEIATPRQVADYLGLRNSETIRVCVRQGRLHAIRPGGRGIRIERRELERFLANAIDVRPTYKRRTGRPPRPQPAAIMSGDS
jgi:excisionase family DNA binding protein